MDYNFNFCRKCGYQNAAKNNFCGRCGESLKTVASIIGAEGQAPAGGAAAGGTARAPVKAKAQAAQPSKCPNCKFSNAPDAAFCKKCGLPISKEITVEDQEDLVVIKINLENFDFENHIMLRPVFKSLMKKKIIIDLHNVKWMDSTGIGTLVTLAYQGARSGQSLKIIGMNKKIFDAVKSLQVDNVLELAESVNSCRVEWGLPPV